MKKNRFRKFLVFILVFAWLFTGWPAIWQNPRIPPKIKEAQAAVSFIGVSNLIATDGDAPGAITPNASTLDGDLLVFFHYSRAAGGNETVAQSSFTFPFNSVTTGYGLVAVGWRIKQAGDTTFTATITNHDGSTETVLEWIETYRGFNASNPIVNYTAALSTWASGTNVGPIAAPATATVHDGDMVVVFGGRFENIITQTALSGDNLTWTAQTRDNSNSGSDAGAVTQNGLNSSGSDQTVTAKTITTTGTVQVGAGRMFILEKTNTTTLGNGASEPDNITIGPGDGATDLDNFTLVTSGGADTVIAATVALGPADAFNNIAQVDITDTANTAKCTAVTGLSSNTVTFSICNISVGVGATAYKVRITPKTHPDMPVVPGASYDTTGTVTDITCTNSKSLNDSGSATVVIDNASPGNVIGIGGTAGNQQVQLNWTNPGDSSSVLVLHRANIAVGNTPPTEGDTYIVDDPIGSSTVACVENSPSASCTDTGLINNTPYHYKIFTKDSRGNYDAGTVPSGSPFTPFLVSISITDREISFDMLGLGKSAMSTSDAQIIYIDQGPADLDIRSTYYSTGVGDTWTLNNTSSNNLVKWEFSKDGSSWSTFLVADSLYLFDAGVGVGETRNAYFKITIPTFTDSYEQYSTTVTVVASAPS